MKNSEDHPHATGTPQTACSELNCATCFQNKGCIYDVYLITRQTLAEEIQHKNASSQQKIQRA
jgi:hypothetical protein